MFRRSDLLEINIFVCYIKGPNIKFYNAFNITTYCEIEQYVETETTKIICPEDGCAQRIVICDYQ